jgi:thioredoxin reductase (NADPH)
VHRGAKLSAQAHLVDAMKRHENIKPVWNSVAEAIIGGQMVEKVRVRNTADNTTVEIPCTGFFAYIGLEPAAEFAPAELARDADGFLVTDPALATKMPGVFAAGAVRAGYRGLLTHSIADGNAAAKAAKAAVGG